MSGLSSIILFAIFAVGAAATWVAGVYLSKTTDALDDRLRSRAAQPAAFSDADADIAARMKAATDPWPEAQTIDTQGAPADSLRLALRSLARV